MPVTSLYASNGGKPKFNEFITPIGVAVHSYHDKAQVQTDDKTQAPILDKDGIPRADFKVTVAWEKNRLQSDLAELVQLAGRTRDEAWGADCVNDQWFRLQPVFRDGDNPEHNTKRRDYLFGKYYMNFKGKAVPVIDPVTGKHTGSYMGAPGLVDEYNNDMLPVDFWAGCECRVSGIMFGTEYMGKNFISTRLNNIQRAKKGERLGGGGRPDAKKQFDPLGGSAGGGAFGGFSGIL